VTVGPAFGNTLRRLRRDVGLTQEDVADILELSRGAIAQWETGRSDPPARRLPDLAAILNTSIQKLFEE
jgi:transcriptional regulator with XRE-family HTH domain